MKFHVYVDLAGGYRWRLLANNNKIIGDSAEAYVNKQHAIDMAFHIIKHVPQAKVYDKTK